MASKLITFSASVQILKDILWFKRPLSISTSTWKVFSSRTGQQERSDGSEVSLHCRELQSGLTVRVLGHQSDLWPPRAQRQIGGHQESRGWIRYQGHFSEERSPAQSDDTVGFIKQWQNYWALSPRRTNRIEIST